MDGWLIEVIRDESSISIFVSLTVAKTMKIRQDYYVAPTSIGTVCSTILSSANIEIIKYSHTLDDITELLVSLNDLFRSTFLYSIL